MSLLDGVAALLWADATFRQLAPGGISYIFKPEGIPQPAVAYQVVGASSAPTMDTHGTVKRRVQFDIFAETASAAVSVRDRLFQLLDGARGTLPTGDWLVLGEFIQDIDFFDQEPRSFRIAAEYYLSFNL